MLLFEWDKNKAKRNLKTHAVSFDEASTAFGDTLSLTIYDPLHSRNEDRMILIGNSHKNRLLVYSSYGKERYNQNNKRKKSNKE